MSILNNNINYTKPFQKQADIAFLPDVPAVLVNIAATLNKPAVSIHLSTIHEVSISGTLSKPAVSVQLSNIHKVSIAATLQPPIPTFYAIYDNNVWRGVENNFDGVYIHTLKQDPPSIISDWQRNQRMDTYKQSSFKSTSDLLNDFISDFDPTIKVDDSMFGVFSEAAPLGNEKASLYDATLIRDTHSNAPWQESRSKESAVSFLHDESLHRDNSDLAKWRDSIGKNRDWSISGQSSQVFNKIMVVPWQESKRCPAEYWSRPPIPPIEPPIITDNDIAFGDYLFDITNEIIFGIRTPGNRILAKKVYYMLNQFYLRRVSDQAEIEISSMTATLDQESYTWRFSFNVLGTTSYQRLKDYEPMELELMVNGYKWKILVIDVRQSHSFGSNGYSATGIGLAGYLSELYTDRRNRTEATIMTVEQLAVSEVLNTPWTINWAAGNWVVPENTYSYQDKAVIDALVDIASSTGAFILPHRENLSMTVKSKYPVAPWLFNSQTPDLVMAPDPIISRELSYRKQQDWNSVWVSGTTSSGILGFVKRTGTAGDRQPNAPITHQLITDPDGARAMGIRYLGDTLSRYEHTFVLPLTDDVPLIEEGILLQVNDPAPFRGLVTSIAVGINLSSNVVTVNQTIQIQQYET